MATPGMRASNADCSETSTGRRRNDRERKADRATASRVGDHQPRQHQHSGRVERRFMLGGEVDRDTETER
ncbi:MAG: hypothetical protein ACXWLC_11595, partial [Rhizomicrobium sp.]